MFNVERLFHDPIFFGNDLASHKVKQVHTLLDEAFDIISAIQQPLPCTEEFTPEMTVHERDLYIRLRIIQEDIITAIGYKQY